MEFSSQGALLVLAGVSLLSAVAAVALAVLAAGTLRRAARRAAGQVREMRRHPLVGDLPQESEPSFRSLILELNLLLQDLRGRVREAERRSAELDALSEGPPDLALVRTDAEWRIASFSRGAVTMTGWPREEVLDRHVEVLFAPGEWERLIPKLSRRTLREAGIAEAADLQRRDGRRFPAALSLAPPPGEGATGMLLVARDVTAEREIQRRLQDSEDRYRGLVEGMSDGLFILQGLRIVYANPALARLAGREREALLGRPFKELILAEDLLRVVELLERVQRGESGVSGEFVCRVRGSGATPLEARVAWALTEHGGGRAILGTVVDLTQRARLERGLAASEARLNAILHSTQEGILVLSEGAGGRAVSVANRAFCDLWGLFPERLPGTTEEDLARSLGARSTDAARVEAFFAQARGTGEARVEDLEIGVPRPAHIELTAGPVRAASGEALGLILTARDVTARAELERGLRRGVDEATRAKAELEAAYRELAEAQKTLAQRNEQLEKLNTELRSLDEMKSNLLANVSHELHTPLVSIKGYTEMILRRRLGPLTPEQERGLGVALKNIDRLIEMIDNLLSFSRIEKGETQLHLEDVPLWSIVDEAIEMVAERVRRKSITITTQYETDDLAVRTDRVKVGQVLTNLLTNAVKFNKEGGRITIGARRGPRGFVEVEVADTGIGIAPEEQGRIFERFYQVDGSPRRRYEGTGIGLSIVRDILRLHGCSIRLQSEPGQGSTFTFTLPLAREQAPLGVRPPLAGGDVDEPR
jgi:PAS domain S-box-containing protein